MTVFLYCLLLNSDSHFSSSKYHLFNKRISHYDLGFIFEADISSYCLMEHNIFFITYSLFPSTALLYQESASNRTCNALRKTSVITTKSKRSMGSLEIPFKGAMGVQSEL